MAKDLQELQESDVVFPDLEPHNLENEACLDDREMGRRNTRLSCNKKSKKEKVMASSLPVNIPASIFPATVRDDLEEEGDDGEMVPPHIILGGRIAGKMAFSVCTGNGRTLKGRDLSQVRNSILRMTGFLET